jgi:hypothetical protein
MDGQGKGTGRLSKSGESGIRTGMDKLREMDDILARNAPQEHVTTVYVGDSNTDLPCLLKAGIGIVIGDGESLIKTCGRVGVNVISNISLPDIIKSSPENRLTKTLYHYKDWQEILDGGLID